jgi:hypothetical protein
MMIVIYNHNMFIVQATEQVTINAVLYECPNMLV